jgi:hypothetical protein
MVDNEIVEKLSVPRAKLEAATTGPAIIAVTSARPTDGSELLAHGLAMSLASVSHDVLLLNSTSSARVRGTARIGFRETRDGVPTIANLAPSYSLEAAQLAFEEYRRTFRFTVVSAIRPTENGSMLSLIGAADFVVIGVEEGRSSKAEDRELAEALRAASANVLGVVTIDRAAIRRYGNDAKKSEIRDYRFDREEATAQGTQRASAIS